MFVAGFFSDMVTKSKQNLAFRKKDSIFNKNALSNNQKSTTSSSKEHKESINKFHSNFRSRKENRKKRFQIAIILIVISFILIQFLGSL